MTGFLFQEHLDMTIAALLIVVGVALFLLSRIHLLPKKSLPYVAAAIAGAITLGLARSWWRSKLLKELDERKEKADKRDEELKELKKHLDTEYEKKVKEKESIDQQNEGLKILKARREEVLQKVAEAEADLDRERKAYMEVIRNAAREKQDEVDRIDQEFAEKSDRERLEALLELAKQ